MVSHHGKASCGPEVPVRSGDAPAATRHVVGFFEPPVFEFFEFAFPKPSLGFERAPNS
jgi:hypothetical protein